MVEEISSTFDTFIDCVLTVDTVASKGLRCYWSQQHCQEWCMRPDLPLKQLVHSVAAVLQVAEKTGLSDSEHTL